MKNTLFSIISRSISLSLVGVFLALAGSLGCGSDLPTANLRFLQASPDAPALTITLDGNQIAANVLYQDDTGYLAVEEGPQEIRIRDAATNDTVLILDPNFTAGLDYTIVLVDPFVSLEALILNDNNQAPTAGEFKFRFLHMAPSAGPLDVYIFPPEFDVDTSIALTSDVEYQGGTDYEDLLAGTYTVAVTPTGQKTVLKATAPLNFGAGAIQTIVLLDSPGGGAPFLLQILSDVE